MDFTILLVSSNNSIREIEIYDEEVISFFKKERQIFSGDLSDLTPVTRRKIEDKFKNPCGIKLGAAHVFTIIALAGEKKYPQVSEFIARMQNKYSGQYIVGR